LPATGYSLPPPKIGGKNARETPRLVAAMALLFDDDKEEGKWQ
jgi:hypothetical protein